MPHWLKYVLLIFIFLILVSRPLAMQFSTGALEGTVSDEFGPVANASIEARCTATGAIHWAQTDSRGYYRMEALRSGHYSLWVKSAGHDSTWIREVIVEAGRTTRADVHLSRARAIPTFGIPTT
jgi:hypothetical protein